MGIIAGGANLFEIALEKDFRQKVAKIRLELKNKHLSKEQVFSLKEQLAELALKYDEQKRGIPHSFF